MASNKMLVLSMRLGSKKGSLKYEAHYVIFDNFCHWKETHNPYDLGYVNISAILNDEEDRSTVVHCWSRSSRQWKVFSFDFMIPYKSILNPPFETIWNYWRRNNL